MILEELIKDLSIREVVSASLSDALKTEITGLAYDSRHVSPGDLFAAIPGTKEDGHRYIHEAIQKGASLLLVSQKIQIGVNIPQVVTENVRETLAQMASRFYGEPSRRLNVVGVTGTNGKTTVTYLVESILKAEGRKPAVLGTVNYRFESQVFSATHTTPESVDLQKLFSKMKEAGVTDVVMEVSSHALSMGRVLGVEFDVAAFTNLTQDHLDYHQSMQDYFEAKLRFFTDVLSQSTKKKKSAVLNMEDSYSDDIRHLCPEPSLLVGLTGPYDISCHSFELSAEGIRAKIVEKQKPHEFFEITSPLIGRFNLENILVAIGIARALGISQKVIVKGIAGLSCVPGRLERILNERGVLAFVDYAHTPDALARIGETLKPLAKGRILTVFGCGGDRDRSKRPLMGKEASRFSDLLFVTSDNPRTEDPEKIIDEILVGIEEAHFPRERVFTILDRGASLRAAVQEARRGDILLVAGKGHEDYQIIGKEKHHFSDQESLRKIFNS